MFLYNFEAATLLKASFVYYSVMYVCVTEKRNFHHARDHDSFPYITSSQRKKNSALKYLEIYLKHLAYTGIMQSEEPSDSSKWRGTLDAVLCKVEVQPVLLRPQ